MSWWKNIKLVKPTPIDSPASRAPWMGIAYGERGQKEIRGSKDNPRIISYHATTSLKATEDETPWCSSFINWVFKTYNPKWKRTNSARAASWLSWGRLMLKPEYGCVVVKSRPLNGNPTGGNHVTFFVRLEERDGVEGFIGYGGNQGNEVNETWYPLSTVRGYRWPMEAK